MNSKPSNSKTVTQVEKWMDQVADRPDHNGRIYPREVLEKAIAEMDARKLDELEDRVSAHRTAIKFHEVPVLFTVLTHRRTHETGFDTKQHYKPSAYFLQDGADLLNYHQYSKHAQYHEQYLDYALSSVYGMKDYPPRKKPMVNILSTVYSPSS